MILFTASFSFREHLFVTDSCTLMCVHHVSSQDSVVEIAFIPGKGLFPSSTSLHNGVQRAAGNNYNAGRLKVHIRSPEVSSTVPYTSTYPVCTFIHLVAFTYTDMYEREESVFQSE